MKALALVFLLFATSPIVVDTRVSRSVTVSREGSTVQKDHRPTYYMCAKDETMVRVKPGRGPAELKCPLDGTPMKAGTGSDKQIFLIQ